MLSSRLRSSPTGLRHASFIDGLVDVGFVVLGGPISDERRVVLAIKADSERTVRETLA
jgi:hypothetical protein